MAFTFTPPARTNTGTYNLTTFIPIRSNRTIKAVYISTLFSTTISTIKTIISIPIISIQTDKTEYIFLPGVSALSSSKTTTSTPTQYIQTDTMVSISTVSGETTFKPSPSKITIFIRI